MPSGKNSLNSNPDDLRTWHLEAKHGVMVVLNRKKPIEATDMGLILFTKNTKRPQYLQRIAICCLASACLDSRMLNISIVMRNLYTIVTTVK